MIEQGGGYLEHDFRGILVVEASILELGWKDMIFQRFNMNKIYGIFFGKYF
jgi:hypothetical protein